MAIASMLGYGAASLGGYELLKYLFSGGANPEKEMKSLGAQSQYAQKRALGMLAESESARRTGAGVQRRGSGFEDEDLMSLLSHMSMPEMMGMEDEDPDIAAILGELTDDPQIASRAIAASGPPTDPLLESYPGSRALRQREAMV